jgi:hypothetical protein
MNKIFIQYGLVCLSTILMYIVNAYLLLSGCQNISAWFILLGVYFVCLILIHIEDIYNKIGEHYVEKNYGHNRY